MNADMLLDAFEKIDDAYIIEDLVDKMMETIYTCGSYIHSRSFSYSFKTFKDCNAR